MENEQAYQNAYSRLIAKKRQRLLHILHRMSSERMFLLELKAEYSGVKLWLIVLFFHR